MANRWFQESLNNLVKGLTVLEGHVNIGASGAASDLQGNGIASVERVAAGVYKVVLSDPYHRFLGFNANTRSVVGSATTDLDDVSTGGVYVITVVGDATRAQWTASGLPASVTPAVGAAFVGVTASAAGTTSKVGICTEATVEGFEILGDPNMTINNAASPHFYFQTMHTAAAADPADGSALDFSVLLRVSSVTGKGE